MHLQSVRPIDFLEIYINGDVTIDESAVVAPGTILNAAPNSRIVIGAGVCLGMGTILNACHGAIEVEEGATLGAGVLTIGQVKIGKNACIGTATTIINASVDKMAVIPAGSLIGDTSRQETIDPGTQTNNSHKTLLDPWEETKNSESEESKLSTAESEVQVKFDRADSQPNLVPAKPAVVGQMYINQLLVTLFPERNSKILPKKDSD